MRLILHHVILFFLSTAFISALSAQDSAYKEPIAVIDSWIEAQMIYEKIPGFTVAIVKDQKLIWSKGYGFADVENKVPMKPETLCSICSISKLFTSIAVMQLWEQGKLRLDDSVAMYLPDFKVKQDFESVPITIRGLLTHSAGLPRESAQGYWTSPFIFPTEKEINGKLGEQRTLYPSSREFQYSNLGMTLLGQIVAKVSGMPYDQYVQEKILKPMGLSNTRPIMPKELYGKALAKGYSGLPRDGKRRLLPFFTANGITPAAGFSSSALDLAKFAQWQNRLLKSKTPEILKQSTLREMQRVQWHDPAGNSNWGLGFLISNENGKTIVGHEGSCPGYRTVILLDQKSGLAVMVFVNAAGVNPQKFVGGIFKIIESYESTVRAAAPTSNLADYAGNYDTIDWGNETWIVPWKGKLLMYSLPSNDPIPASPRLLTATSTPDHFRFDRKDDLPGIPVRFEREANGQVRRFWMHSNAREKMR
jgi:CubicO group peptidase (beta-lactamase class C family)